MWFQLHIEGCDTKDVDQLSETLEEFGALSITLTDKEDNPILEPQPGCTPLWPKFIVHALFAQAEVAQAVKTHLAANIPALQCRLEILEDKDWERVWMDDFKPQRFGKRLWICPSWHTPPEADAVNLMLDPGLAFGTGMHPTTGLCLTWLEQRDLHNKVLIDYGCGSGILALAALKLGAQQVLAVDIDEQALQATQNNAESNNINTEQLIIGMPDTLDTPVDLIIANILMTPLLALKDRFHQLLHPGATLVVSGLLAEQTTPIKEAYAPLFHCVNTEYLDNWGLLVFNAR